MEKSFNFARWPTHIVSSNGGEVVVGTSNGTIRRLLGTVGAWRAAHLNEFDQAPVVISPVEPH